MDIRSIRSFVAVVESGSFSAASAVVNVTQSAVSQHIKAMEDEIGMSLLIRSSHSVMMTEAGNVLYEYAKKILYLKEECTDKLSSMKGCLTGELRIGVGSFIEPYIRGAAIEFMKKYPGVRLSVEFSKACRLNQMLREHKIDIAFTMNTAHEEEGIDSKPAIPFRVNAIMSKNHALAGKEIVTYEDLCACDIIMPDVGDRVYATVQRYLNHDLTRLKVKAIVSSSGAALNVLDELNCITFLPKMYLSCHDGLTAIPIEGLEKDIISYAHWMKDVATKESAKAFLEEVIRYSKRREQPE